MHAMLGEIFWGAAQLDGVVEKRERRVEEEIEMEEGCGMAYRATYSRQGGDTVWALAQDVARGLHQEWRHQQRQGCDACTCHMPTINPKHTCDSPAALSRSPEPHLTEARHALHAIKVPSWHIFGLMGGPYTRATRCMQVEHP